MLIIANLTPICATDSIFITELRSSDVGASDELKKSVSHFMKHAIDTQGCP